MSRISKQVIVMRKTFVVDGKVVTPRKGKFAAQCSHASLGAIINEMDKWSEKGKTYLRLDLKEGSALKDWLDNSFTKIAVYVETEEELLEIYNKAKAAKLISCLITDSGKTEFNGVPTKTCCSILGWDDEVDKITGHLKLL